VSLTEARVTSVAFDVDLSAHGDRPALLTDDRVVTYAQLELRVDEIADRLGPTRRLVALEAVPDVDSIAGYLAALRGGHPILLLAPDSDSATRRLVDAYAPDVVMSADTDWVPVQRRRGSSHELHPDLALLLSTSGSTGSPKLVRLSAEGVRANAASIASYLQLTPDDRAITTLPLHYCYGLSVLNSHLAVGAGVVLQRASVVDPCFWRRFAAADVTNLAGVPYTFEMLERTGFDSMSLPSLRFVTQAGGRMPADSVRRFAELGQRDGWRLFVMYGQTEATARMAYLPPELALSHPHAIGVAIPGGSLDIDPLNGDRDFGELVYRGPNVMLGYASTPADLATGRVVHELRTGDLARRGADGVFEISGRLSRFVKPFGVRVDLDELEKRLDETGIAAMCSGDDTRIAVAVKNAAQSDAAVAAVAGRTGLPTRHVAAVVFDELPRLPNGKADHAAVLAAADAPHEVPAATAPAPADAVVAAYTDVLGVEVTAEDSFVSAGGDSLSYVELSVRLEELLGTLPAAWHLQPIASLRGESRPRRWVHRVETTVVLRAVAIVLIVGTHAKIWRVLGGAHVMLGIAGYNFARFQSTARGAWRSARRVAVPALLWVAPIAAISGQFDWTHAVFANSVLGDTGDRWAYWFTEALVQLLVVVGAVLAVPGVRRAQRRAPFLAALVFAAITLALRFDVIELGRHGHRTLRADEVAWLFALGWLAALATTVPRRLLTSALMLFSVWGFFGSEQRETILVLGLVAAVWLPTVPLPAPFHRIVARLASASLWIYLTHWQVYPPVVRAVGRPAAFAVSLAVGVVAWQLYRVLESRVAAFRRRDSRSSRSAALSVSASAAS
jgi:acyl-CoA synthetase (AMP-forming)/AMP-acid ligase II